MQAEPRPRRFRWKYSSGVQQQPSCQGLSELAQGVAGRLVGVDLQCDRDLSVPQDPLSDVRVDVEAPKERRACSPSAPDRDPAHTGPRHARSQNRSVFWS